jgi:hypothetical protein
VIFPVEFFIDKSQVSENGWLHLELVMFTFSFFPQETKNISSAWHPLGYVNDLDVMSSAQKSSQKRGDPARDYHKIMDVILSSVVDLQSSGSIPLQLPFGNEGNLNMQFPISYIIGDIKGLSLLCGMYGNSNCAQIH